MLRKHYRALGLAALAVIFAACSTAAQTKKSEARPTGFSFQTNWWLRYESRETTNFNARNGTDARDQNSRLSFSLAWQDPKGWGAFFQPQYSYRHNAGFASALGTVDSFDFHQAFVELPGKHSVLRIGRQEIALGEQRLVGPANWGSVGRSFDGLRLTLLGGKSARTDFIAARLGHAANRTSDPYLFGVYSTLTRSKTDALDLYLLGKDDHLNGTQNVWTLGTRPRLAWKRLDFTGEAAFQFGTNAGRQISAGAYTLQMGYTLPGRSQTRFALTNEWASGGDPSGPGVHTFDQLFPSPHPFYGLMDLMGWRNMRHWRALMQTRVSSRLGFQAEAHAFGLANTRDFWYAASGRPNRGADGKNLHDTTGAAGGDVGSELDFTFNYALNPYITLIGGYSRFMPGEFVRQTNGGAANPSDRLWLQTRYSF